MCPLYSHLDCSSAAYEYSTPESHCCCKLDGPKSSLIVMELLDYRRKSPPDQDPAKIRRPPCLTSCLGGSLLASLSGMSID